MPLQKFTDRTAKPLFPLHPAGKNRHISGANCGTRVIEAGKVLVLDVERGSFIEADAVMGVQPVQDCTAFQLQ